MKPTVLSSKKTILVQLTGLPSFQKYHIVSHIVCQKVLIRMDFIILESVNTQKSLFGDFPAALPQIPGFFALSQTTDMTGATPY
jgi:hypothetical protein